MSGQPKVLGSCPTCGRTIYHDSRFVSDQMNVWCPEHAPERPDLPDDPDFYIDGEPFKLPDNGQCVRCKLRVPMDGADFCEGCARDRDFDYHAISKHAGDYARYARNVSDCPNCLKPGGGPNRGIVRILEFAYCVPCAYRLSKERALGHNYAAATKNLVTSKGINENLAANEARKSFAEMTPEERGKAMDKALIDAGVMPPGHTLFPPEGAKIVMNRPVRSDRWEAAERLARLVLAWQLDKYPHDWTRWGKMVEEARRVLGEKP